MDDSTITVNTTDTACSGSIQLSSDIFSTCVQMVADPTSDLSGTAFSFSPASDLSYNTTYMIKVTTQATGMNGEELQGIFLQDNGFTVTDGIPTVKSTTPADGTSDIPLSPSITVAFSEVMDDTTITVNAIDTTCSGAIQLSSDGFSTCVVMANSPTVDSAGKEFTISPKSILSASTTYVLKVTTDASSSDGIPLAGDFIQATGFTTIALTTTNFSITQDTWIDSSITNSNNGSDDELKIGEGGGVGNNNYEALMGFDLSSLSDKTVVSATLYLRKHSFDTDSDNVYITLTSSSWDANANWLSIPGSPSTVGPSETVLYLSRPLVWAGADVTEKIQYWLTNSGTVTGFVIRTIGGQLFLESSEATSAQPYLEAEYY